MSCLLINIIESNNNWNKEEKVIGVGEMCCGNIMTLCVFFFIIIIIWRNIYIYFGGSGKKRVLENKSMAFIKNINKN